MVNNELLSPKSILVVGGSNDNQKPGGKILMNIREGDYQGKLMVLNPKESIVQGITSYQDIHKVPDVELAIIAVAAKIIPDLVDTLAFEKNTRAFIIISAGFSEESEEGRRLEKRVVETVNKVKGALIGPNCIGILTPEYHGVFTRPIPRLTLGGVDFISGSGATACFIMENGISKGLSFARVFSVGNSAQMGVEEILQYMDETFDPAISPKVKLLYMETISKPDLLLKHASSLIRKGCRMAGIKAGSSEAGSRAASSHTGALASSDMAVEALFKKAGIVRCLGREELINVASVFMHKALKGKNIGIITHAGGPAVMLTDALSREGFQVPTIRNPKAKDLLELLYPGSSVANPIDFLATGTAKQLGKIIDYADQYFDEIDGMVIIFGTPGLVRISDVYEVLDQKMKTTIKPIFPVLPSIYTASPEIREFLEKGRINFPDEVLLAHALGLAFFTPKPAGNHSVSHLDDKNQIRQIIEQAEDGYLPPISVMQLLDAVKIPRVPEEVTESSGQAVKAACKFGYPVVMKVIGPLHKSETGGVRLNIMNEDEVAVAFHDIMKMKDALAVMIQPMIHGIELFTGAKSEDKFGHLILCGMGGIFIETLRDFSTGLVPLSKTETLNMIRNLKSYPILEGARGQKGANIDLFAEIICRLSDLLRAAPEIRELDLNPLIASGDDIYAVDARIRIMKKIGN